MEKHERKRERNNSDAWFTTNNSSRETNDDEDMDQDVAWKEEDKDHKIFNGQFDGGAA